MLIASALAALPAPGAGETIAIVDAYNDPNIVSDLATFDKQFGIAAPPSFKIVNETGGTSLPANNRGWSSEIALDVEWAHAIAPGANILLVEASSASTTDLDKAEDFARNAAGVVVVSNSWGSSEYSSESSEDVHFTTPTGHAGVTFTVAAGDEGTGAEYPSSSPDVLSVGGSTLRLTSSGAYSSESVWSDGGGGKSLYEGLPSFQSGFTTGNRGTPDVSYDANPSTGIAVYDSYGSGGWAQFGGTSAGAPQWARDHCHCRSRPAHWLAKARWPMLRMQSTRSPVPTSTTLPVAATDCRPPADTISPPAAARQLQIWWSPDW